MKLTLFRIYRGDAYASDVILFGVFIYKVFSLLKTLHLISYS